MSDPAKQAPQLEQPVHFRLMATDDSPYFDPVSHVSGTWYGVARIEHDAPEVERLRKRGCAEITEVVYADFLKKKHREQNQSDSYRFALEAAQAAVRPAASVAPKPSQPQPSVPALKLDDLAKPAAVPRRRAEVIHE